MKSAFDRLMNLVGDGIVSRDMADNIVRHASSPEEIDKQIGVLESLRGKVHQQEPPKLDVRVLGGDGVNS